jgi:hypothetical protein
MKIKKYHQTSESLVFLSITFDISHFFPGLVGYLACNIHAQYPIIVIIVLVYTDEQYWVKNHEPTLVRPLEAGAIWIFFLGNLVIVRIELIYTKFS